jgi:UDP-N-acetylglucosamine acyltransferase
VGDGCRLHNNVTLVGNTVLGTENEVFPGAVLGAIPQDKKYRGEASWLIIGNNNTIRECVTIHSGTEQGGGVTKIGDRNLIMAGCHVAHDCILHDDIIMANNVLLGGHVLVEKHATFGGLAAVHHYVTVGQYSFIGGMSRISRDVPPYLLVEGNPPKVWCVNKVGLRRKGFSAESVRAIKEAHRLIFRGSLPRREAVRRVAESNGGQYEVQVLVEFLKQTERGNLGRARQP